MTHSFPLTFQSGPFFEAAPPSGLPPPPTPPPPRPAPARPAPPPRRGREGEASPSRPGLGPRGNLRLGTALAAPELRRRRVLPPRPPRVPEGRDPARALWTGGGALGGPAGGAGARLRAPPRGALRARRAPPGGGDDLRGRPAGHGRRAPGARGLLCPVAPARHRALAEAHGDLRGLAGIHPAQGGAPHGGGDRAHPARAAAAPRVSLAAPLPLPAG